MSSASLDRGIGTRTDRGDASEEHQRDFIPANVVPHEEVTEAEWYNDSNTTVIHPKPAQKEKLHMRDDVFEFEDIDLIAGGISLQRGKLPEHVITLADEWLLRASKVERRALRARSNPVT